MSCIITLHAEKDTNYYSNNNILSELINKYKIGENFENKDSLY